MRKSHAFIICLYLFLSIGVSAFYDREKWLSKTFNLSAAYAKLGSYQEAWESFKKAIRIKPAFAEAHYNLGLTYLQLGDKCCALEEYKILKQLDRNKADELFNQIYKK